MTRSFTSLLVIFTLFLMGCSGFQARRGDPSRPHGDVVRADSPGDGSRKSFESPTIALVLGGAGVASFATVGLLKRLQEEGIKVELIVSTGWPTLFALGAGFLKSVHDVEWFAMRLQEKDFYSAGILDTNSDFASHDNLSSLIEGSFKQKDLLESKVPLIVSATNTELGEPEIFERGDWKVPLLKTMSVPGIYRPYPDNSDAGFISSLQGIDVEEATRRKGKFVVAVDMYEDYFDHIKEARKVDSERLFRKLYLNQIRKGLNAQLQKANVVAHITLKKSPRDFGAKRTAILAGYREGIALGKRIKAAWNDPNRPTEIPAE